MGQVSGQTTTYLQYPNLVRVETRLAESSVVQVYDGTHAWVRDRSGTHDVPAPMLRDIDAGLKRDTVALLIAAADGAVRARVLPDVKDDHGKLHRLLELSSPDLDPLVLYIDPETGLVAKQAYVAGAPGQPLVEELFSDYKLVDGVQVAFTARVRRGGTPVLDRRLKDIKINAPIDPALFKRPS
jgi:hypothetical protein